MALKPEDVQAAESEYQDAFNEPEIAPSDVSDDEAFGLNVPDETPADETVTIDTDDTMKTQAEGAMEAAEGEGNQPPAEGEQPAPEGDGQEVMAAEEAVTEEAPAEQESMSDDEPTDPKEIQRKKSWEGRLRKREEELAALAAELEAKKAAPAAPAEPMIVDDATDSSREKAVEAVEDAIEAVEDGEMTPEQAMKTLSEDFGPEFAKMLKVLMKAEVSSEVSKVAGDVDSLIEAIKDDKARSHFEAIADKHPDFHELGASDEMKAYLDGMSDEDRQAAMQVVEGGSTRQVIKFLDKFKEWQAANQPAPAAETEAEQPSMEDSAQQDDAAMDAAEGVRSTGLRLPTQPGRSDDYESAWNSF